MMMIKFTDDACLFIRVTSLHSYNLPLIYALQPAPQASPPGSQ